MQSFRERRNFGRVGSLNMLQAISAFDPSRAYATEQPMGSDPNHVPEISIRGENGFDLRVLPMIPIANRMLPLYIMDGIEVTATTVYDLDMNRVEAFFYFKGCVGHGSLRFKGC